MVNHAGKVASAKPIVNIYHADPASTGIQHGQQRGKALEISPIPNAGGDCNYRAVAQAPNDAGEGAFHAG